MMVRDEDRTRVLSLEADSAMAARQRYWINEATNAKKRSEILWDERDRWRRTKAILICVIVVLVVAVIAQAIFIGGLLSKLNELAR